MNYEQFVEKLKEGEKYADTIRPKNIFNKIELELFQKKMMSWLDENVSSTDLQNLHKQKGDVVLKRILAITAEGKTLENSLL